MVGRLAAAAMTPRMYPVATVARAFWFDGIANFGDGLTPWLLRRAGVIPIYSTAEASNLVGVGSILEMLPECYGGAVWGTGSLQGRPITLPDAKFLAVRGELTRELVSAGTDTALGDPGILASRFMKRPRPRHQLGVVPHHMHEDDPLWAKAATLKGVKVINVRRGPSAVLRDIAQCEAILTTSLHGLITADSFGIPVAWTHRKPDLWGGQFKFHDYESAITPAKPRFVEVASVRDVMAIPRLAVPIDALLVRRRQDGLLEALQSADLPRTNPAGALLHVRPSSSGSTARRT